MARILIIDDEPGMRSFLHRILERLGHHVVMAEDGRTGLEAVSRSPFDLIVTDLLMPGMEGIEFLFQLRQKANRVPVIAMSGGGRMGPDHYAKMPRLAGAARFLSKPFTVEELREVVDRLLAVPAPDLPPPTGEAGSPPPPPSVTPPEIT